MSVDTNLEPKHASLKTRLGLSREQLCKAVVAHPNVLSYSVDKNLEPPLAFYGEKLGVDREGLAAFIRRSRSLTK